MTSMGPFIASTYAETQPELTKEKKILVDVREIGLSKTMTLEQKCKKLRKYVHWQSIFTSNHPVTANHPVFDLKLNKGKVSKKPISLQFSCRKIGDVFITSGSEPHVINNGIIYTLETFYR